MVEARFWKATVDGQVACSLCRFECSIAPGHTGRCHVRLNQDGRLYSLVYGRVVAQGVDPVEKKPLYHILPGHQSYSISTVGCNFHCLHCQNDHISQPPFPAMSLEGAQVPAEAIVQNALEKGCRSIAYTYTEPTIFIEYVQDVSRLAREAGLLNLWVSNGYITESALREVAPLIDGINVDLKGFNDATHRQLTGASVEGVKQTLSLLRELGIWLEVTTLLIPTINDSDEEIQAMAEFIAHTLGIDTPWHLSAFYPAYRLLDKPPTPPSTLIRAQQIGQAAGLRYIYLGNLQSTDGKQTLCPRCGVCVVERSGWRALSKAEEGHCPSCREEIPGVWQVKSPGVDDS